MSSSDVRVARLTALAALGIALLYFVSVPIGSLASLPASNASAPAVAQFFAQHRVGFLVAVVLNGIAWCALLPVAFQPRPRTPARPTDRPPSERSARALR